MDFTRKATQKEIEEHKRSTAHRYNAEAVDKEIERDRRAGRKISAKERRLIHALLKGHY